MESLTRFATEGSPFVIGMVLLFICFLLWRIPIMVKSMGLKKLGPLEIEHKNQSFNYQINKLVEEVDITQRERMWEMTEDLIGEYAEASQLKCQAAIGYICHSIINPIRTMVLLNHIAKHLVIENEKILRAKILRGIHKTIRNTNTSMEYMHCADTDNMLKINLEGYDNIIDDWLTRARSICSQECANKIRIYRRAIENTEDKYWRTIYKDCIAKNTHYIEGMGYTAPDPSDEFSSPRKMRGKERESYER